MATTPEVAGLSDAKRRLLERRLSGASAAAPRIARRAQAQPPLSYAQERLWFMDQFRPGSTEYALPIVLRLRGELDAAALGVALERVVARHESLRTRFPASADGRPTAIVEESVVIQVRRAVAADRESARALVAEHVAQPFDLARGPLLRALLVELGAAEHVLAIGVHHIACDGQSAPILFGDLVREYDAARAGEPSPLAPLEVRYGDYAAWQRAAGLRTRDVDYWRERLAGLGPLALPADRPRPPEQSFAGAGLGLRVDRGLTERLEELARELDATLYTVLLAAHAAVLGRWSGSHDVAIGCPVAGRDQRELEPMVGMFVNMLALRLDLTGNPTFAELVARAREVALDGFTHRTLPFEQLVAELDVERDISRSPLFQATLALQNYGGSEHEFAALDTDGFPLDVTATRFDLELFLEADDDGSLDGLFTYNADLFDTATIERLGQGLQRLLADAAARPHARLSELALLGEDEHAEIAAFERGPVTDYPDDATLHELVGVTSGREPAAVAISFEGDELTYGELELRSNRLAHRLRAAGVTPGSLVAVCAERSLDLVPTLLGILKAGGAYVPLDPEYPAARLAFMLEDCGARLLLADAAGRASVETPEGVLAIDTGDRCEEWPGSPPEQRARAADPAYAIYTSGSTGTPKCAVVSHRAICNRLDWMQWTYQLSGTDTVVQKTPLSFDVSVWELFWPLLAGARLALARPGGHKDAAYLRELIVSERVTTAHFVPSMLSAFLADEHVEDCAALRLIVCSGEELAPDLARECVGRLPAQLHNLYGPTEAAIDVSSWHCTAESLAEEGPVPIGRPIQNVTLRVLGDGGGEPPRGCFGELHIGGVCLAEGYHRRPELTAQRFVSSPSGERLYRTGDLARWRADGALEFGGRIDGQVKLRGLRIELGEIDAALRARPEVVNAATIVREDRPGDKRLVAYIVAVGEIDRDSLQRALRERLPDYMVPAAFVGLDALPISPSGKLDRRALPEPEFERGGGELVAPRTAVERTLADVWAQLLGAEGIGIDDDFFDLGGHSLLATQVVARLRRELDAGAAPVSVMDLFRHRTIRALGELIDLPSDARGSGLLHELTPPREEATVSFVCAPYGGGSAVVYQPLAEALPDHARLLSIAIPGHDIGLLEDPLPFDELAERLTEEILAGVEGPLVLYGHCGGGSALTIELAQRLEAAGRELEAVYIGGIFPFAKPDGRLLRRLSDFAAGDARVGDRVFENWLRSLGLDLSGLEPEEARRVVRNLRRDTRGAEQYYSDLLASGSASLRAPLVSVVGERDPHTDYYQERFREWHFLTDTSSVVVLDEAGHFFLKYRARELATIVTDTHRAVAAGNEAALGHAARGDHATWWLHDVSRKADADVADATAPDATPTMRRFFAVAAGQFASMTGSALTEFALPLWIYIETGSLVSFALFAALGLIPGILVAPLAGAVVDRCDRRRVMLTADAAAGVTQAIMAALVLFGELRIWQIYVLLVALSVALTFQRLAFTSAIPQLVPKRYLGHANGLTQMAIGTAQFVTPLVAVAMLSSIGLGGILVLDVVSYVIALAVLATIRFPISMPYRRRESLGAEIRAGLRYSWGHTGFRSMLIFFALLNLFLAPMFMMISPLVLSFGDLGDVGRVAVLGGAGAAVGGIAVALWGGPGRRRLHGMLLITFALAASCAVVGLRPSLPLIAAGAFAMSLTLALVNGIYATILHVKVPQRFHGRVFALNTMIAFSTLPIGFAVIAPLATALLEPLMADGGALASSAGAVLGTGEGRGIGLMYVVFALGMVVLVAVSLRMRRIASFDDEVADAAPDDLVGLEALRARSESSGALDARQSAPGFSL